MNLSAPFVRRPVATTLLTIGATLVGLVAFPFLPVASLPQVIRPLPSPTSQSSTRMFSTGGLSSSRSARGPLLPLSAILSSLVEM